MGGAKGIRYIPEEIREMIDEILIRHRQMTEEMYAQNKMPGRPSKNFKLNKRGTAGDIAFLAGAGAMIMFFGIIIIHYTFTTLFNGLLGVALVEESAGEYIRQSQAIFNNLDWISIVWFVAVIVTLVATSFVTQGKPVLIIGYIFVIIISVFLSMLTSNFWEDLTATALSTSVAYFPIANHFMNNLPIYVAIAGIIGMIFSFAKPGEEALGGFT